MENSVSVKYKNKTYNLCSHMYGALSYDYANPLCCVSEANNSFSIDYFKGCSFQCAYCHVQGIREDLDQNLHMYKYPQPRNKFSIEEIVDSLVSHPYFIKDESVISICTSSTEPFATEKTTKMTIKIMKYFVNKGYNNPFWIVTKAGVPNNIINDMKKIASNGNKIMISFCYAGNPKEIEPMQNDRFKNIELVHSKNIYTSWYLRPLVKEWGANKKKLEIIFKNVSKNYNYIDMIIPGGLRWTDGIEFGMHIVRGKKMPNLVKKYDQKTLSSDLENCIIMLCKKYFPNKPVYFNSSCAISHMLERNNIALLNILKDNICGKSLCNNPQKKFCQISSVSPDLLKVIQDNLDKRKIKIKIESIDKINGIKSTPNINNFDYTIKQEIKKTIAYTIYKTYKGGKK